MNVVIGHGRRSSSHVIPLEQRLNNVEPTTGFTGPIFSISTKTKDKDKEVDDVEIKAAIRWAGKTKPAGQFLDADDTTETPCVICGEEDFGLKCDNNVTAFMEKVNKKVPGGIQGAKIKTDLLVEMGCCCQTLHVGCLLTWWLTRSHWTCPHCREVYLEGNKDQNYPRSRDERQDIIVQQVYDAVTRTIWNLNTDPTDDEDDEFDDDDRFEFTDLSDDDLTTLEGLLGR